MLQAMVNAQALDAPGHMDTSTPAALASRGEQQCLRQAHERYNERYNKASEQHQEHLDVCKQGNDAAMADSSTVR